MSSSSSSVFKKQVHFEEEGHCWLPKISSTMTLKLKMVCFQGGENEEIMYIFVVLGVYSNVPMPSTFHDDRRTWLCCSFEDNFELRMTQM
jgi:hypothetical protein